MALTPTYDQRNKIATVTGMIDSAGDAVELVSTAVSGQECVPVVVQGNNAAAPANQWEQYALLTYSLQGQLLHYIQFPDFVGDDRNKNWDLLLKVGGAASRTIDIIAIWVKLIPDATDTTYPMETPIPVNMLAGQAVTEFGYGPTFLTGPHPTTPVYRLYIGVQFASVPAVGQSVTFSVYRRERP